MDAQTTVAEKKPITRGGWLTAFLLGAFAFNILSILLYLDRWDFMSARQPTWAVVTLRTIVFLRTASLIAMWHWSRSGVIGYIILSFVAIPACIALGDSKSVGAIIGVVILIAIVMPKWRYMYWGISANPRH